MPAIRWDRGVTAFRACEITVGYFGALPKGLLLGLFGPRKSACLLYVFGLYGLLAREVVCIMPLRAKKPSQLLTCGN